MKKKDLEKEGKKQIEIALKNIGINVKNIIRSEVNNG